MMIAEPSLLLGRPRWVNRDLPRAPPRRLWGAPRRAWAPPIDYRHGLPPSLDQPTRKLTSPHHPTGRSRPSAARSRSPGMSGRDRSEQVVAIPGMRNWPCDAPAPLAGVARSAVGQQITKLDEEIGRCRAVVARGLGGSAGQP